MKKTGSGAVLQVEHLSFKYEDGSGYIIKT